MARQWRIEYPGALYHVLSRGNGGQDIFLSDGNRQLFLSLIGAMSERFDVKVHAYVLMSNHYHLLLQTVDANLSKAMQWFGTTYTRRFNLINGHAGHLFQGRFKSIIVENDAYLVRLSYYIHRNPLRAGLVERLAEYPWSSYRCYAYGRRPPAWLKTDPILNQMSGGDIHKSYRMNARKYSDEENRVLEDVKHGFIFGGQAFVSKLKALFLDDKPNAELPQHNRMFRELDSESILNQASAILEFDLEAARNSKKILSPEKDKRDLLVYLLWETGRLSNREIGTHFGLTYSSISRRVKMTNERISADRTLRETYQKIKSQIKV